MPGVHRFQHIRSSRNDLQKIHTQSVPVTFYYYTPSISRSSLLRRILLLTGGRVFRKSPQLIFANHLCCLTSLAPLLLPNLVLSHLSSKRIMQSFPALKKQESVNEQFPFSSNMMMRGLFDARASSQASKKKCNHDSR